MSGELENARKLFALKHKEWEAVNNPKGFEAGEVHIAFDSRTVALLALVRVQEPYRKIISLLKSPRNK